MVSGVETCAIFRIVTENYKYYLLVHIAINFLRLHLQYAEPSESTAQAVATTVTCDVYTCSYNVYSVIISLTEIRGIRISLSRDTSLARPRVFRMLLIEIPLEECNPVNFNTISFIFLRPQLMS